jgi:ubiquinone/menaquinone biosynthesis C-methylase UbiE
MWSRMSDASITRHYNRLARRYDQRWRAYLRSTLGSALDALQLQGTERILDVGCGTGEFERYALARFPRLQLIGIDATPGMIEMAKQKFTGCSAAQFQMGQADVLPLQAEHVDVVVCTNMFHHVRHPMVALGEFVNVLRPGGQLLLLDWCRDFWHCRAMHLWLRLADRTYVKMYRMAELTAMLETVGLTVRQARRFISPPVYGMMQCLAQKSVRTPPP